MTKSLIQKLRDATGGTRELDAAIHDAMLPPIEEREGFKKCYRRVEGAAVVSYWQYASGRTGHSTSLLFPEYTTSLDAIIGLIEEKLPGSSVLTAMSPEKTVCDIHEKPLGQVGKWHGHADHADKVLALCLALLSALAGES